MTALILTLSISMSISFLCSILEACLLSLSTADIASISERRPKIAKIWTNFKGNIQTPIAVILIVNTFAHTIGASLSGAQFSEIYGVKYITLFSITYSFVMIQWAEILPKTFGIRYNKLIAAKIGTPFNILVLIFKPIVYITELFNRPFNPKGLHITDTDELNDIRLLARFATFNKKITNDHAEILSQAVMLNRIKTKDIMVEKDDIRFLTSEMSLMDALVEAHIHHHTRLPLVENRDINNIIGYVNFKDIVSALQINPKDPSLRGIARTITSVNENDSLTTLLNYLIKSYQHIAIVKSSNGNTVGIVTLEDVIEAIVGDINDEYDILPSYLHQITLKRYLASGGYPLNDLSRRLDLITESHKQTLNEFLIELNLGNLPKNEDRLKYGRFTFIIKKIRRSSIFEIIIEVED